jgi:hypothetical protein
MSLVTEYATAVHCVPESGGYSIQSLNALPYQEYVYDSTTLSITQYTVVDRCIMPESVYMDLSAQGVLLPGSILPECSSDLLNVDGQNSRVCCVISSESQQQQREQEQEQEQEAFVYRRSTDYSGESQSFDFDFDIALEGGCDSETSRALVQELRSVLDNQQQQQQ